MMNRSRTFWEVALNCVLLGMVIEVICIFLPFSLWDLSLGLWIGVGIAIAMLAGIETSLEQSMEMQENASVKFSKSRAVLRYVLVVLAFGIVLVYEIGNPVACFAGIMTLKVGAYLQPFTHKILSKRKK